MEMFRQIYDKVIRIKIKVVEFRSEYVRGKQKRQPEPFLLENNSGCRGGDAITDVISSLLDEFLAEYLESFHHTMLNISS